MNWNENGLKTMVITLLLGLVSLVALLLETRLVRGALELFVLLVLLAGSTILLFGFWSKQPWTKTLGLGLFIAHLVNLIGLFALTSSSLPFAFGILVSVAGLVMCMMQEEMPEYYSPVQETQSIETYDLEEMKKDLAQMKRKRGRPRKNPIL